MPKSPPKETTADTQAERSAVELLPLPVVERDLGEPAPVEPPVTEDGKSAEKQEPEVINPALDARERIAKRYEEQRVAERDKHGPLYEDEEPDIEAEVDKAEVAPVEPEKPADPTIDVVVDGKARKLTQAELIAAAQKSLAADNRLDEAKQVLAEVKALRAEGKQPDTKVVDPKPEKSGQPDPRPVQNQYEAAQLLDYVEKLQTGDKEEAAASLATLLNDATTRTGKQLDEVRGSVQTEISTALIREREARLAADAITRFAENHKVIAEDRDLTNLTYMHVVNEIADDFAGLGMRDEDVQMLRDNPQVTRDTYQKYRSMRDAQGKPVYDKLRDHDAILSAAGAKVMAGLERIAADLGYTKTAPTQPNPSPTVRVDRTARKESIETQPRPTAAGNGRARLEGKKPEISAEQARREGFEQLRASRGAISRH